MFVDKPTPKGSLSDTDIITRSSLGRRAFLSTAVGGAALLATRQAQAATDSDTGTYADPDGSGGAEGSNGRYTGVSDRDYGAATDPEGEGTPTGHSDHDEGATADASGNGTP